jgi:hypothetical protein
VDALTAFDLIETTAEQVQRTRQVQRVLAAEISATACYLTV